MAERYVGIDLNEKYAMVSYYAQGMSEPGTFSMVTGSEAYQIPVCLCKKKDGMQWLYGEEAKRYAKEENTVCMDGLLKKALASESVELEGTLYEAADLLFLFLKKLLTLPPQNGEEPLPEKIVITTENMNLEYRRLFGLFAERMEIPSECLLLLDYRESFYFYAFSQQQELCRNDVVLYYYTVGKLFCWILNREKQTVPQVVTLEEKRYEAMLTERDEAFSRLVKESLKGKIVSTVYLIGDGFDGGWMKQSLAVLCCGRRVFMGKNLFCKGACYAAAAKSGKEDWPYVFMGDNELKLNISLKVERQGKPEFFTMITAGENWYEAGGECEVILKGTPSVEFWFQPPRSMEASVRSLELKDLPLREERTTRLRITAKPVAADRIVFRIIDLGFGEIVRSSEKVWEYMVTV